MTCPARDHRHPERTREGSSPEAQRRSTIRSGADVRGQILLSLRSLWMTIATVFTAAAALGAEGPFHFNRPDLMKSPARGVFVAFMGNYRTPAVSGQWSGWNHAGEGGKRHDPDQHDASGRRDMASCFYPAIGPYDMSDPDVVDYHCQLVKMSGIDGISFNLMFFDKDPWRQKSMKLYVNAMHRYGLSGIVRFEDKFYKNEYADPDQALHMTVADMDAWLKLMEPVQYRINGRPVFMLFTFVISPEKLKAWKENFPPDKRPIIVTFGSNPKYKGIVDGRFGWTGNQPNRATKPPYVTYVNPEMMRANEQRDRVRAAELLDSGAISLYFAGVSPGFDDIGCWGWGNGPRKVERDDGRTYQYRWEQVLKTDLPLVFIPTWNDWSEGTTIEPAVEYGTRYLSMTRDYAARFKNTAATSGDLQVPVWIYKIRKSTSDAAALAEMKRAAEQIAAGDNTAAQLLVQPWAKKLGVDVLNLWDASK